MAFLTKSRPISLIMKDHVIRFVDLSSTTPLRIEDYDERYIAPGIIQDGKIVDRESLQLILEECVEEWGIAKRLVQFIVPGTYIIIRQIEIPLELKVDEIKGYLFMELGSSIHLPFEEPVFDYVILGESEDARRILLFAAPQSIVSEYESLFEDAKLKPVAADVSPLSIYRLYHKLQQSSSKDHLMVVQFDTVMANVCIFYDDKPVFMRHLTMGIDSYQWKPSQDGKTLEWTGDPVEMYGEFDNIYMEIDRIIDFYSSTLTHGDAAISKILLTGDHPKFKEVYDGLHNRHGIEITQIDAKRLPIMNEPEASRKYYLALGLALKEV